jgi:hypothetical protein
MLVLVGLLVGLGDRARADEAAGGSPEGKAHVGAAVTAYGVGDYETASHEFASAFALDHDPVLLYAWAQARRLGGRCTEAVKLYKQYLGTHPNASQVDAANTGISICAQAMTAEPQAHAAPAPRPRADAREQASWFADPLGGALTAGGAAALGTGITFLVLSSHSEAASRRAEFRDQYADLLDEATLRRRIGWAGVGIGAALSIGGIVRYATHDRSRRYVAFGTTGSSIFAYGSF